jgi:hypothetical protein
MKHKKILLAHSNHGEFLANWHENRKDVANELGYNLQNFKMIDYHPYTIFPYLDRKWKKKDYTLMKFYEKLGESINDCDVFIHYNGALIHPQFLEQFKNKIKIYHCADDPDATNVLSKPVALNYDYCAISNPTSINTYKSWGCKRVFFWPLGAFHYNDNFINLNKNIPLIFIGSKNGVTNIRYIGRFLGLYRKTSFMNRLEKRFPELLAYGSNWKLGKIEDDKIPDIYSRSLIGINIHNSIGPVNARLYDLSAFGVCQICDNKKNLHHVFENNSEIIGFDNEKECFELIDYYLNHPTEAMKIGENARQRFLNEYTTANIWLNFFKNLDNFNE